VVINPDAPPGDVVEAAAALVLEWALERLASAGAGPDEKAAGRRR
jgi:hypothetical protein